MADGFKKREQGEERKFELDQQLQFKAQSRRNKLLGLWLAGVFGHKNADAEAYAKEVVISDLDEPGDEDVVRKVMADIAREKAPVTEEQVRKKLVELEAIAIQQIKAENKAG